MPRTNSLTFRLIAGAAIWTVLGLVAGGFVLSGIFRNTVESSFDAQLVFNLDGLIAAAESDSEDSVTLEGRFADPRFERIFSGWYWQIRPAQADTEFELQPQTSRSLWDQTLTPGDLVEGANNSTWGYADGPDQQRLRVLMRRIALPVASAEDVGQTQLFDFVVAGDISETEANIVLFNRTLLWSIAVFSLGLIAAMFIQVRVGLMPLRRVSEALARIREGRARRLEGEFPTEIAPLATELNSLIAHSSEVVGRARAHVANLAHFLKTPLTVLANEAATASGPLAETVSRQVTVMRRQVDHYLARARAAGALDVLGSRTEVAPVLDDLARVLKRMHADKELDDRGHGAARARVSRRARGSGRDGRQSDRQCLQMGAQPHRGRGRRRWTAPASRCAWTTTDRASSPRNARARCSGASASTNPFPAPVSVSPSCATSPSSMAAISRSTNPRWAASK